MVFPLNPAPHAKPVTAVPIVMRRVLYALLPAFAVYWWNFGPGIAINLMVALAAALLGEAFMLRARACDLRHGLTDGSAIVTAVLIVFALPPLAPWWLTALAVVVAIVIGKQLFGGLGANVFNPAMVGYVTVLLSFPAEMTQWLPPGGQAELGLVGHLAYAFGGRLPEGMSVDAVTQATALDVVKQELANMRTIEEIRVGPMFGDLGSRGWQWINVSIAAGGLLLLHWRIIRWHIPVAVLAGLLIPAALLHLIDTSRYLSPVFHLFSGATLLGAFFIATDPVSAAATSKGRLIYGAGIGALTYAIRTWGGYPDGLAFAVLLMNASVPILDRYTQPRIYGR
jgi:electron transport complex protein RnfD